MREAFSKLLFFEIINTSGRITRTQLITLSLRDIFYSSIVFGLICIWFNVSNKSFGYVGSLVDMFSVVLFIFLAIILFLRLYSNATRRLHDLNRSEAWFLALFVPLLNIYFILSLVFLPGTVGTNGYGKDPVSA